MTPLKTNWQLQCSRLFPTFLKKKDLIFPCKPLCRRRLSSCKMLIEKHPINIRIRRIMMTPIEHKQIRNEKLASPPWKTKVTPTSGV